MSRIFKNEKKCGTKLEKILWYMLNFEDYLRNILHSDWIHRKTFSNSKQIGTLEFQVLTIIKNQLMVNWIKTSVKKG